MATLALELGIDSGTDRICIRDPVRGCGTVLGAKREMLEPSRAAYDAQPSISAGRLVRPTVLLTVALPISKIFKICQALGGSVVAATRPADRQRSGRRWPGSPGTLVVGRRL